MNRKEYIESINKDILMLNDEGLSLVCHFIFYIKNIFTTYEE